MPETPPDLSVVVPVYANEATLAELVRRIETALTRAGIRFEILFVNDAGPDGSLALLRRLADHNHAVRLVVMGHNVGQHAAVLHGLRFARGHCCAVMDADLQDPPEALARLWRAREDGVAAVFAGRRGHYQQPARMLTSRLYKRLLHQLTGIPKDAGIFVLMERPLIDTLLLLPVRAPWINVMIGLTGLATRSVPVRRNTRSSGTSAYTSWGRLRTALRGIGCVIGYRLRPNGRPYLATLKSDPVAIAPGATSGAPPAGKPTLR